MSGRGPLKKMKSPEYQYPQPRVIPFTAFNPIGMLPAPSDKLEGAAFPRCVSVTITWRWRNGHGVAIAGWFIGRSASGRRIVEAAGSRLSDEGGRFKRVSLKSLASIFLGNRWELFAFQFTPAAAKLMARSHGPRYFCRSRYENNVFPTVSHRWEAVINLVGASTPDAFPLAPLPFCSLDLSDRS